MSSILHGNGVILRALEPEDLEFLFSIENDADIWHVSNTLAPYSKYILKQYIENSHHDIYTNKQLRLIISEESKSHTAIGAIDLFDFDPFHMRAGVGILIHGKHNKSKGYATTALKLLINYCFKHLQLKQIYCNIAASNTISISLFEKCGFEKCGDKKQWLKTVNGFESELIFQLLN